MKEILVSLFLIIIFVPQNVFAKEITTWKRIETTTITIGDWTPPTTKIYIKDKEIIETITNGDFSKQKEGWNFSDNELGKDKENTFAVLKSHNSPLTQQIKNTHGFLLFSYKSFTEENLKDFDDPAFIVKIQNKEVYSITAEEIKEIDPSNWTQVIIPLSSFNEDVLTISFSSGNTGDNEKPSWTYIDNVTTKAVAVASEKDIRTVSEKNATQFFKEQENNEVFLKENLYIKTGFSTLTYWSEDEYQNREEEQHIQIFHPDEDEVHLTDITAKKERNNEVRLNFQTHSETKSTIVSYQFAFINKESIEKNEWKKLPKINPLNSPSLYQIGRIEDLFFPSTDNKYFSIGCIDIFGNIQKIFVVNIGEFDE